MPESSRQKDSAPPRPAVTREMVVEAATKLAQRECWDESQVADLAYVYEPHMDGYELAKALESDCLWDIDVSDVEALDSMFHEVQRVHEKACVAWVQEHNIQPPLPVGTMTTRGEIAGVYEHGPAMYRVRAHGETNDKRFLLVKFEDAVPENTGSAA